MNLNTNNKGFSLLEVMVTVGIIGIITTIAIPSYNSYRDSAAVSSATSSLKNIATAYSSCMMVGTGECTDWNKIGLQNFTGKQDNNGAVVGTGSNPSDPDQCFGIQQKVGGNRYLGCVAIDQDTGSQILTIGYYKKQGNTEHHQTNTKFCYCKTTSVSSLQGQGTKCPGGTSNCSPCPTGSTQECKAQEGRCDGAGKCI